MQSTETQSQRYAPLKDEADGLVLAVVAHPGADLLGVRRALSRNTQPVLGRSASSFFPGLFDDPKVSREHARLDYDGDRLVIRDLESHNGTYVNGAPSRERELVEGDLVGIGNVVLLVVRGPDAFVEPDHPRLLGTSYPLARLLEQVERFARDQETLLIVGETGSGKELVARAIHEQSGCRGSYVPLNCGGLPEGVLHSELFGHVRGAFSGAESDRRGLVGMAERGTLFLDEVASSPSGLQTSLLRLLDDGKYRVVGTSELLQADVRVIAAMQPVEERGDGRLRRDLYHRLARRIIRVPPLRERREDIPILARHFASKVSGKDSQLGVPLLTALIQYSWPGNVRELRSVLERIALEQPDADELTAPDWLKDALSSSAPKPTAASSVASARGGGTKKRRRRPPRETLMAALTDHDGSVAALAAAWEVDRKTIYRWIDGLEIDLDQVRRRVQS